MRPPDRTVPGLAEALPDLESSLAHDASPRNVIRVAEACWLAGEAERAVAHLEGLVAASSGSVTARLLLGWCYEAVGRAEESERLRAEAWSLEPANPYAADTGPAEEETGIAAAAHAAAHADPDEDPETEAEPEAALTPEQLRHVPPSPLYSATLAEIFEEQGFEEKAIEIYREIVRQNPEREDLRARIEALEAGGVRE